MWERPDGRECSVVDGVRIGLKARSQKQILFTALVSKNRAGKLAGGMEAKTYAYTTFRGAVEGVHTATLRLRAAAAGAPPAPVLVYLHGGYWKPQWGVHNLDTTGLFAAFGTDHVATWSVEYARVDQLDPAASVAGGGWPHTCLDVLAALNTLTVLPEETRAQLDLSRVYLCGHSAGGHLALWLGVLSRLSRGELERVAFAIGKVAGADAAAAAMAGITESITVRGVIGLAAVTSLTACAALGLSDFHDAALHFLWRVGPSAGGAIASGQLGAACPLALWTSLPDEPPADGIATAAGALTASAAGSAEGAGGEAPSSSSSGPPLRPRSAPPPPLRVLLVHGLDDVDVPASLSLSLAAAAWTAPLPPPLWLLLLPGCDHYVVAGLGNTDVSNPTPGAPWPRLAAALRAFVAEDAPCLDGACCTSIAAATPMISTAIEPVCARRTMGSIATDDDEFKQWAETNPEAAAAMARGLRRWLAWVSEAPAEVVRIWLEAHDAS